MPKVVKGRTASISYFGNLVSLNVPDCHGPYGMIHSLTLPTTEFKKLYQELLVEEAALATEMGAAAEGCCHKTRLLRATCPVGRKCPYD